MQIAFSYDCTPHFVCFTQYFTGKERDTESGLDYFGARYYASSMGRFMSPDEPFADQKAADPQSWNLYSYVRNNPLRLVDPTGNGATPANSLALTVLLNTQFVTTRDALIASPNSSPRELEMFLDSGKGFDPRVFGAVAEATAASFLASAPTGGNGMTFDFQPKDLSAFGVRPDVKWTNTNNTVFQDNTGVPAGTPIYLEVKAVSGAYAFDNLMRGAEQTADTATALARAGSGGAAALVVDAKTWGALSSDQQSALQSAVGGGKILRVDGLNAGTNARINQIRKEYNAFKHPFGGGSK